MPILLYNRETTRAWREELLPLTALIPGKTEDDRRRIPVSAKAVAVAHSLQARWEKLEPVLPKWKISGSHSVILSTW